MIRFVDDCNTNDESSVYGALCESISQLAGGAAMVLIAESHTFATTDNDSITLAADVSLSDSDELAEFAAVLEAASHRFEYDLRTLGAYCDEETKPVMDYFKRQYRENVSNRSGWIRHSKVLESVCKGEVLELYNQTEVDQSEELSSQMLEHHPKIHNVYATPLYDLKEDTKVLGVMVVANFPTAIVGDLGVMLKPLISATRIVLSEQMHREMYQISTSVVDHIQTPIVVFRRRPACPQNNFYCSSHNRAFSEQMLQGRLNSNVQGYSLFQCFPQFRHTPALMDALESVFSDDSSDRSKACLEALHYEDVFVPNGVYTIHLCQVNRDTFIFSIENVSEQIRARILSEEIAQAKEQFVANVSHEIRTPLNGIMGYIAMMSDHNELQHLSEYQRNCFAQIKDCSMSLLYIMNDILDFSKLNADQMKLKEEVFEFSSLLEKSYDVVLPSAREKGLEMAFFIDPNVPARVKGDFKKLRQILLNLLSNGVKFTHCGRVDTTVKVVKDHITHRDVDIRGRHTLEFCVQDSGIGISNKDLRKLFQPFSQIDQSDQKNYQGTGLGLIISKKLVELMGGTIRVESSTGEGTSFIFNVKVEEAQPTSPETQSQWLPLLKDRSVLIVDDHVTNRITISSFLMRWGMKPVVCGSGEEALLYVRGDIMQFDMALIDMRMPKMDGNSLASKMKQFVPNLPLVAISSSPVPASSVDKSFTFFLTKPIKHRQLFNVCVAVCKKITNTATTKSTKPKTTPATTTTADSEKVAQLQPPSHSGPSDHPASLSTSPQNRRFKYPESDELQCKKPDRNILICEDLYTNQQVAIGFLEKLGYTNVTIAEDGIAAKDAVKRKHYDVILMDLKMPRMDGFEATRRIRAHYKKHAIKPEPFIIAVTANAMGNVREKCAVAGMDAYITKPLDMRELANLMNEAVT